MPIEEFPHARARLLAAVYLGSVRLIDNVEVT
jgi:pantothenate synthetase